MFLSAQDMRDAEIGIIGARGHVICRHPCRAKQCEILEVTGRLGDRAVDEIRYNDFPARFAGHPEPQYEWLAGVGAAIALLTGEVAHRSEERRVGKECRSGW